MAALLPGKFIYLSTPHTATISTTTALAELFGGGAWVTVLNETKKLGFKHTFARNTHHHTRAQLQEEYPDAFKGGEIAILRRILLAGLSIGKQLWALLQEAPVKEDPPEDDDLTFFEGLSDRNRGALDSMCNA